MFFKAVCWSVDQRNREARVLAGECVVANMSEGADEALVDWAKETGRLTRIDYGAPWSNPFVTPADGDRAVVLRRFRAEVLPDLVSQLPTLRGRVLGCWCHPEPCHGHMIAEAANQTEPAYA